MEVSAMAQETRRRLLTEKEAAAYLGMSCRYLRAQRCYPNPESPGPAFVKLRRAVRYAVDDLDSWISLYRREPSVTVAPARRSEGVGGVR